MTATASPPPTNRLRGDDFDPDAYRMSVGEHLEELRVRLIWGIAGLAVAFVFCLIFGTQMISWFCAPLVNTLRDYDINPQLYDREVGGAFSVYIRVALVSGTVIASPWLVFQLWKFVAAGLYPNERRQVTKYLPLSIGLLVFAEGFVYFLVLPWTLQFFIGFSTGIPLRYDSPAGVAEWNESPVAPDAPKAPDLVLPKLAGDPATPADRQLWYDSVQQRVKFYIDGKVRVLQFGPDNLIAPQYTLDDYIGLVEAMLLTFGLCFQTPLVVLALARMGIIEPDALAGFRKHVYLVLTVLAAAITPGDVITATLALIVPLALLFELGIWLARRGEGAAA